jgi:hypothetical protein
LRLRRKIEIDANPKVDKADRLPSHLIALEVREDLLLDCSEYLSLIFENFLLIFQNFLESPLILLNGSLVIEDALLVFQDRRLVVDDALLVRENFLV